MNLPPRVLQMTKFYPPVRGGMESVVATLAEGLNRAGLATDVLCAHTGPRSVRELHPGGWTVIRAARWGQCLGVSVAPMLLESWRRARPHTTLVHVHMPDPLTALALWLHPPQGPLVVHWHSDVVRQRRAMRLYAPLQRWLLERADRVVVTSEAYGRASPWLAPWAAKCRVVPLGIADPQCGTPAQDARPQALVPAIERLRARLNGCRLVFALGRMAGYKGFEHLVAAAADLPPDVRIVIGGAGPQAPGLHRQVQALGLSDRVWLPGALTPSEVAAHFHCAQVFCLPSVSRAEAFGVVLLEAMAHGVPVVATDLPGSGVPWVNRHGHSGLNVPPADAHALAAALRWLLDHPEPARRMGQAGRQRFLQEFQAERMVGAVAGIYRELGVG